MLNCLACFDDVPVSEIVPLGCAHAFCKHCVERLVREHKPLPLCPMPKCGAPVSDGVVRGVLGEAGLQAFHEALSHRALQQLPDMISCPNPSCKERLVCEGPFRQKHSCSCGHPPFCTGCGQLYHHHVDCAAVGSLQERWLAWLSRGRDERKASEVSFESFRAERVQALEVLAQRRRDLEEDEKWKAENCRLCPHCSRVVEKISGCDSMVCGSNYHGGNEQQGCGGRFVFSQAPKYSAVMSHRLPHLDMTHVILSGAGCRHLFTRCAVCLKMVHGLRFRCIHCEEYNLCQSCEADLHGHPSDHVFEILSSPAEEPIKDLTAGTQVSIFGTSGANASLNGCTAKVRRYGRQTGVYELEICGGLTAVLSHECLQPDVDDPAAAQDILELALGQQQVRQEGQLGVEIGSRVQVNIASLASHVAPDICSIAGTSCDVNEAIDPVSRVCFYDPVFAQYGIQLEAGSSASTTATIQRVAVRHVEPLVTSLHQVKETMQRHWKETWRLEAVEQSTNIIAHCNLDVPRGCLVGLLGIADSACAFVESYEKDGRYRVCLRNEANLTRSGTYRWIVAGELVPFLHAEHDPITAAQTIRARHLAELQRLKKVVETNALAKEFKLGIPSGHLVRFVGSYKPVEHTGLALITDSHPDGSYTLRLRDSQGSYNDEDRRDMKNFYLWSSAEDVEPVFYDTEEPVAAMYLLKERHADHREYLLKARTAALRTTHAALGGLFPGALAHWKGRPAATFEKVTDAKQVPGTAMLEKVANAKQGFGILVGQRVQVAKRHGIVRFYGVTRFADGEWVGIELDDAVGKNNGMVMGISYFECPPAHGIFVRPNMVQQGSSQVLMETGCRPCGYSVSKESDTGEELPSLDGEWVSVPGARRYSISGQCINSFSGQQWILDMTSIEGHASFTCKAGFQTWVAKLIEPDSLLWSNNDLWIRSDRCECVVVDACSKDGWFKVRLPDRWRRAFTLTRWVQYYELEPLFYGTSDPMSAADNVLVQHDAALKHERLVQLANGQITGCNLGLPEHTRVKVLGCKAGDHYSACAIVLSYGFDGTYAIRARDDDLMYADGHPRRRVEASQLQPILHDESDPVSAAQRITGYHQREEQRLMLVKEANLMAAACCHGLPVGTQVTGSLPSEFHCNCCISWISSAQACKIHSPMQGSGAGHFYEVTIARYGSPCQLCMVPASCVRPVFWREEFPLVAASAAVQCHKAFKQQDSENAACVQLQCAVREETAGQNHIESETLQSFRELGIAEHLLRALDEMCFSAPCHGSLNCWQRMLRGENLVSVNTVGRGCAVSYLVAMMHRLSREQHPCQGLVVVPSCFDVLLLHGVAVHLSRYTSIKIFAGQESFLGLPLEPPCSFIAIGTLHAFGRLFGEQQYKANVSVMVLDGAAEMLADSCTELHSVFQHIPKDSQVCFFSGPKLRQSSKEEQPSWPAMVSSSTPTTPIAPLVVAPPTAVPAPGHSAPSNETLARHSGLETAPARSSACGLQAVCTAPAPVSGNESLARFFENLLKKGVGLHEVASPRSRPAENELRKLQFRDKLEDLLRSRGSHRVRRNAPLPAPRPSRNSIFGDADPAPVPCRPSFNLFGGP